MLYFSENKVRELIQQHVKFNNHIKELVAGAGVKLVHHILVLVLRFILPNYLYT